MDIKTHHLGIIYISKELFDKDCSIQYKNKIDFTYKQKQQVNFYHNTTFFIIQTFDANLLCNVDNELYQLVKLQFTQQHSKIFDIE